MKDPWSESQSLEWLKEVVEKGFLQVVTLLAFHTLGPLRASSDWPARGVRCVLPNPVAHLAACPKTSKNPFWGANI